ncbi:hypothetical protein GMI70_08700 [Eggerthellaceae bacterium zg-893]|nr:hypothetical protein [Eggerthellaceae bacterium zg-893]
MLGAMETQLAIPAFRFCGQAFLYAWRMCVFFAPLMVVFAPDPYACLVEGRLGYLIACAAGLLVPFALGRKGKAVPDKALVAGGTLGASGGTLLALALSSLSAPAAASVAAFAVAGAGDALLTLAFASMYRSVSVQLSMRAVPLAMALAAGIYALAVNNNNAVSLPVVIMLPVACAAVLLHDIGRRDEVAPAAPEGIAQAVEPERSTFTKWKIALYTSVLWLAFGIMWPLAVSRLYGDAPLFLAFSLSVAALVIIVSLSLAVMTYVLRLPTVKTFWIFVPLMFAGFTAVAIIDSNVQVVAFALVFAAHNIAEVQLTTHFSAICRRRGFSTRMLFGCGLAILAFAEAAGVVVGTAVVPLHSTALTMVLLVCANVIVIAVIFSIMRVNTTFQRVELEAALAKQASTPAQAPDANKTASGANAEGSAPQTSEEAPADAAGKQPAKQAAPAAVEAPDAPNAAPASTAPAAATAPAATPAEQAAADWVVRFGLSRREREVAQLLLSGRNVPAVAELLCISQSTVQTHVKHIYEKTGVHTRQELIALGYEQTHPSE